MAGVPASPLPVLSDGGSVSSRVSGITSVLHDHVAPKVATTAERTYLITLTTLHPEPTLRVELRTAPVADWAKSGNTRTVPLPCPHSRIGGGQ